ncbi:MAG: hypothetical protein QNJ47_03790 [Nostocaceae cyanobacterium]|nr:hypothetical protein [Nostocaceae cyanobacterium]
MGVYKKSISKYICRLLVIDRVPTTKHKPLHTKYAAQLDICATNERYSFTKLSSQIFFDVKKQHQALLTLGNRQQATGNRQQATGNRQQATG